MPTDGYAQANGVRIHFTEFAGNGPPLLLVHATGFHGRVWDPFVPGLSEHFSVIAIDQRGHGDSDKPEADYGWERFGHDVQAVVEHLGLRGAAAAGHSSGAVALIFAESWEPGTFSSLVLMDPVTLPAEVRSQMRHNPLAPGARKRRALWNSREEMVERLKAGTRLSGWRDEFLRAYVEHGTYLSEDGRFALKCPPEIEARIYESGGTHDGYERLWSLEARTLVLVGEHSEIWSYSGLMRDVRNGSAEVVSGAGHFFPMEAPEVTLDRMLRFLTE
jgi:pimeloyl-ACP methyl ester carboxylesterase